MDEIKVNIQNYNLVKTNVIDNIKIRINRINLFKSISASVHLFEGTKLIENKVVEITGTEYNNWGNDDQYVINLILTKLGFTQR